jgi:hypothetical protein
MSTSSKTSAKIAKPPIAHGSHARAYEYRDRLFFCSVAGDTETDQITILAGHAGDEAVGDAIIEHLNDYHASPMPTDGDAVPEWQAYKSSGAKSASQFEANLWHVDLESAQWLVEVRARPRKSLREDVAVGAHGAVNDPADIGAAFRIALKGAKALRAGGVI